MQNGNKVDISFNSAINPLMGLDGGSKLGYKKTGSVWAPIK